MQNFDLIQLIVLLLGSGFLGGIIGSLINNYFQNQREENNRLWLARKEIYSKVALEIFNSSYIVEENGGWKILINSSLDLSNKVAPIFLISGKKLRNKTEDFLKLITKKELESVENNKASINLNEFKKLKNEIMELMQKELYIK